MHLEARGLYEIPSFAARPHDKESAPMMTELKENIERNYHGGFYAVVKCGDFWKYPAINFSIPPLLITTHQMDVCEGWSIIINQKSLCSRPRILVRHKSGFGFRLIIKAKQYNSITEVLREAATQYKTVLDENNNLYQSIKIVEQPPIQVPIFVDSPQEDVVEIMRKDNDSILKRLGDWREPSPDRSNVVDFQTYFDRLEAAKSTKTQTYDIEGKIRQYAEIRSSDSTD